MFVSLKQNLFTASQDETFYLGQILRLEKNQCMFTEMP